MKTKINKAKVFPLSTFLLLCLFTFSSCSDSVDVDELPAKPGIDVPAGEAIDASVIFGEWAGGYSVGNTNTSHFTQRYAVSFQDLDDGEAQVSHWFTDATSEMADSTINYEYSYTFDGSDLLMSPKAEYAALGCDTIHGRSLGGNRILLYTDNGGYVDSLATIYRTGDPQPSITGVDRTMPQAGETVTVSGRNLQFVDHLYLPTADGYQEVTDINRGSKQITFTMPEGDFAPGSIRCQSTSAHINCYSPAYMFRTDCVFFHNFNSFGTRAPYTGTEFEYTVNRMNGSLLSNAVNLGSANLPSGHSLANVSFASPDSLLSFFGRTPVDLAVATQPDDKKGYMRFSGSDRFQYVLDHNRGDITANTRCQNLALQMDIYVSTDGQPVWDSGYLSWRLNKDQSALNSSVVANVAMWSQDSPADFSTGWRTFTIPLSAFALTATSASATIGLLTASLRSGNLATILTFVNYPLDELHPAKAISNFQFSIANIRLVPYNTPQPETI